MTGDHWGPDVGGGQAKPEIQGGAGIWRGDLLGKLYHFLAWGSVVKLIQENKNRQQWLRNCVGMAKVT